MKEIRSIFIKNEIKKLFQHGRSHFILLGIVFSLLIIALNQSIFGLKALNEKYNNPFANYIQVATPKNTDLDRENLAKTLIQKFSAEPLKGKLGISRINELSYEFMPFCNPAIDKVKTYKGRTYSKDDPLYQELVKASGDNIITTNKIEEDDITGQYGVIITENMVLDLGYDPRSIKTVPLKLGGKEFVLVPVIVVVKYLPQFSDFMITEDFSYINNQSIEQTNFVDLGSSNFYSIASFNDTSKVLEDARKVLKKDFKDVQCKLIDIDQLNKVSVCEFQLNEYLSAEDKEDMTASLNTGNNKDKLYNFYTLHYVNTENAEKFAPDYLEFQFASLDSIKAFQEVCMQNSLDPDMQIIKSRHLFAEVGSISRIVSGGFILFSILMLFIFTNSFISRHIEEIKPNLGTLLAYGMSGKMIVNNYLIVIFIIYFAAFVIGLVLALFFGLILYFTFSVPIIYNYRVVLLVFIGILITLIYSRSIIFRIFNNTPGDLIYKR